MAIRIRGMRNPSGGNRRFSVIWRGLTLAVVAGILALALAACGSDESSTTDVAAADSDGPTVVIEDLAFGPDALTIKAGETVTWVWNDSVEHDVSGDGFKSEIMSEGTFSHRFDEPGTYDYLCTLHPNMTGTIEVTP
jgi:plastocyanin